MSRKPNQIVKHLACIIRFKQLIALILIVTMSLPQMALGSVPITNGLTESPWLNLPEISLHALDVPDFNELDEMEDYNELRLQSLLRRVGEFDSFTAEEQAIVMSHQGIDINPLAEMSSEELENFLREQEEQSSQDWFTRETAAFTSLLTEGTSFSILSNDDRALILRRLDIAYEALSIAEALFTIMERDGYSLIDAYIHLVKYAKL